MDEFDKLDQLTHKLTTTPELQAAWQAARAKEAAYAMHLLNHSWRLPPEIPRRLRPHCPRLRFCDDAGGWTLNEPTTWILFRDLDEPPLCRRAVWHCKQPRQQKQRLVDFVESDGHVTVPDPQITVADAEVPAAQLDEHLKAIAAHSLPAIWLQHPHEASMTTDVGSVSFEHFSQNDPPATIKYQWSNVRPPEWEPVIDQLERLWTFLNDCFGAATHSADV